MRRGVRAVPSDYKVTYALRNFQRMMQEVLVSDHIVIITWACPDAPVHRDTTFNKVMS